jgi:outer membrane biosynthesis protein TonB
MAEYDADGWQQVLEHEPDRTAEDADSAAPDGAPAPWYRNRVLLALWALMVALLLTLVIYGIVELSRGGGETGGPAPATTSTTQPRSSTTTTTPSTPSTTPTSPTPPPSTTEAPPPETPEQTPEEAPPPANNSPSPAPSPRHHHHLHLPHWF